MKQTSSTIGASLFGFPGTTPIQAPGIPLGRVDYAAIFGSSRAGFERDIIEAGPGILALLAEDFLYKEIALQMNIGFNTVREHVRSICQKLHVTSCTEAVL